MTSNQAIVLAELSKPEHQSIIQEAVELAKKDTAIGSTKVNNISQIAVDWMVCRILFHWMGLNLTTLPFTSRQSSLVSAFSLTWIQKASYMHKRCHLLFIPPPIQ